MDFFYHYPPITTKVSVEITDDNEPSSRFFDCVNVGSEDLKRLFPGLLSDLAVNITPEPAHPAFPPTGLTCWVAPHDSKVRQETLLLEFLMHNLAQSRSMGVPYVSLPRHFSMLSGHRSQTSCVESPLFSFFP